MKNIQKILFDRSDSEGVLSLEVEDNRRKLMKRYTKKIIEKSKVRMKILDLGCANGMVFKNMTKRAEFYGVDIAQYQLRKAKKFGYKKTYLLDLDKDRLPFRDSCFDLVIAGDFIEHIVNTDWVVSEINRVLRRKGKLIVTIPNINHWISYVMMLIFDLPPVFSARFRSCHVRDFTFRTMKYCLREFGFRPIKCSGTGILIPFINRYILLGMTKIIPRLGCEIIYLSKKEKRVKYQEKKAIRV